MEAVIILLTLLPTLYEAWTDRKGETKKEKIIDAVFLVGYAALLTGGAYLFLDEWIAVPLLILMWRIVAFDYLVNAFLKRYSKGHRNINIWRFTGKTSKIDQWVSKIDWRLKLIIRLMVICLSFYLYFFPF